MNRKNTGLALIAGTIFIWLTDRISGAISACFGKLYCGKRYMQPVDGTVGDNTCGFNADMYLAALLIAMFLTGIALFIASNRKP
ncbi:hypothetical protein [Thiolapillus sp.]